MSEKEIKLIDIEEVSKLTGIRVQTIRNKLVTNPHILPQSFKLEEFNLRKWRYDHVIAWIIEQSEKQASTSTDQQSVKDISEIKKKIGRPRNKPKM